MQNLPHLKTSQPHDLLYGNMHEHRAAGEVTLSSYERAFVIVADCKKECRSLTCSGVFLQEVPLARAKAPPRRLLLRVRRLY